MVIKIRLDEVGSDFKDLGKRLNRKFGRTDSKIDHLMYFFLGGIVLKGPLHDQGGSKGLCRRRVVLLKGEGRGLNGFMVR